MLSAEISVKRLRCSLCATLSTHPGIELGERAAHLNRLVRLIIDLKHEKKQIIIGNFEMNFFPASIIRPQNGLIITGQSGERCFAARLALFWAISFFEAWVKPANVN